MARKRRNGERIEPAFKNRSGKGGFFSSGPKESDRKAGRVSRRRAKPTASSEKRQRGGRRGRSRKSRRRGGGLFGFFGRGVKRLVRLSIMLVLFAGLGLTGLVAYYAAKLPPTSEWVLPKRPANVRIVATNGELISNRADTTGQSLSLEEMPEYLPEAVIAIEDRRFYYHFGIDPIGLVRAMAANVQAGDIVQGGSTLTQQLAKNLFLKPERTFERKVQEIILSVWLEASLSKKEILELYLNRVYLGAGAYGVDAAALRYFGKSARNVTLAEAATLAALLKAPSHYSPLVDPDAAEGRAQIVLTAMRQEGYIGDREASLAMSSGVKAVRDVAGGSGRYVADWVMDTLPDYIGSVSEDIVVDTTIDLRLQSAAARAVSETLAEDGAKFGARQGAFVAMNPAGAVKALVGGRDYPASPFNRAVDAHRQPGSAFKPFVYLAALEHGLTPETIRIDQPISIKGWRPENYTRKHLGPVTLQTALSLSLNTVSAQLAYEVGPKTVAATARRLGITSPLLATPSIALGTSEVTLLEMTGAFAPFANGGLGVIPHVVNRIETVGGKVLYERSGSGAGQVVDPAYVGMMNAMLRETLEHGTGKRAAIAGWPAAGKTGTSQDFRDAWFIGYTATMVAGVWFGNDDSTPTKKASGSNLPAIAWQRFMIEALDGVAVAALPGAHAPQVGVRAPTTVIGEDGTVVMAEPDTTFTSGDPDWQTDAPAPSQGATPASVVPQSKKKGFFKQLFGG